MLKDQYIFLCDLNNAFLSISAAEKLQSGEEIDIREIAAVVAGSREGHSIVLAKSEKAKKLEIKTAMQMHEVRNLAPDIQVFPPDYGLYMKASKAFIEILRRFGPTEQYSIDEAFIDINLTGRSDKDPVELAHIIKETVKHELNLTINVGISKTKILAKMAAGIKKPDMVHTLYPEEIEIKLHTMDVGRLFMVGKKTEAKLKRLGILTIGELAAADSYMLQKHFKSYATLIQSYSLGIDYSRVNPIRRHFPRGIGNNATSGFKVVARKDAYLKLLALVESVSSRLRDQKLSTCLIAVHITYADLRHTSHQRKISVTTNSTTYINQIVQELFDESWDQEPVRKLGVRVSELHTDDYCQLSLLENFDFIRHEKIDAAVDQIRERYGYGKIKRASFLHSGISSGVHGMGQENYPIVKTEL